jgi:hypothetical protein
MSEKTQRTFKVKSLDGGNRDNVVRSLEDKIKRGGFHIPPSILDGAKRLQ